MIGLSFAIKTVPAHITVTNSIEAARIAFGFRHRIPALWLILSVAGRPGGKPPQA